MYLVVTDAGDGPSCDHADWADAHLMTASGKLQLTDTQVAKSRHTYGSVQINRNVQGGPIRMGGKSFENGLGTHSTSVIVFDLQQT